MVHVAYLPLAQNVQREQIKLRAAVRPENAEARLSGDLNIRPASWILKKKNYTYTCDVTLRRVLVTIVASGKIN